MVFAFFIVATFYMMKISEIHMITQRTIYLIFTMLVLVSCKDTNESSRKIEPVRVITPNAETTPEDLLLEMVINAHGGELYNEANFSFRFREKEYTFANSGNNYTYTVESSANGDTIIDVFKNGKFSRFMNDQLLELSEKNIAKYSEALNSVIYFVTLPHKLNDPAVIKKYKGTATIKDKNYEILEITFEKNGGGKDFDDVFHYWINSESHKIDYLAYNYRVNEGGVRFRSAYNKRVVSGITFQDYINYKAPVGTPLIDLPVLFEKGELKELSRIETENIINLTDL